MKGLSKKTHEQEESYTDIESYSIKVHFGFVLLLSFGLQPHACKSIPIELKIFRKLSIQMPS